MAKAPNRLLDSELLAILGDATNTLPTTALDDYKNDLLEFISIFNIKPGKDRIFTKILYKLYKAWSPNPIDPIPFSTQIQELFQSIRYGPGNVLLLNQNAINIKRQTFKLLKKQDKTKSKSYKRHFDSYLKQYDIKSGGLFIKDTVLYNLYDKWIYKIKRKRPISFGQFQSFCKLYFKEKFIRPNYWFGVNISIIKHLSEEMMKENKRKHKCKKRKRLVVPKRNIQP